MPECTAPVVIFRFLKDTEEELFKEELHNILISNQAWVDFAVMVDDTHFFIVKHKRQWAREVECQCGEAAASGEAAS